MRFLTGLLFFLVGIGTGRSLAQADFVRVSEQDFHYLELATGQPYVPIGMNLCWPRFETEESAVLAKMEHYFRSLSAEGGNYARLFLSAPVFEVEPEKAGAYEERTARRLDRTVALGRQYGIRLKFCLEHFRTLNPSPARFPGSIPFNRPAYAQRNGGPLPDVTAFFTTPTGKTLFLNRARFLAQRYANDPVVFGWELWNEVDAVQVAPDILLRWTDEMLAEVKKIAPNHLVMQSLGSFDQEKKQAMYRDYAALPGNELVQIHRYLDPGSAWAVCQQPLDTLAYQAVALLRAAQPRKPVVLSEVGAVEAKHAAPSGLYARDSLGTMLHDYLFAPFFAGAAGPGMSWHWHEYVDRHQLWWHFGRFAEAIRGVDPRQEQFEPFRVAHPSLRIYGLKGRKTVLLWCRDARNTYQTELVNGTPPTESPAGLLTLPFPVSATESQFFDPWKNRWEAVRLNKNAVALPAFTRSGVVRIRLVPAKS